MFYTKPQERERIASFEAAQTKAVDLLRIAAASSKLGSHLLQLGAVVESALPITLKNDVAQTSRRQRNHAGPFILMLTKQDAAVINLDPAVDRMAAQQGVDCVPTLTVDPAEFKQTEAMCGVLMWSYDSEPSRRLAGDRIRTSPPLVGPIIMGRQSDRVQSASTMAHEIDHFSFLAIENTCTTPVSSTYETTQMELRGYEVSYEAERAAGLIEDVDFTDIAYQYMNPDDSYDLQSIQDNIFSALNRVYPHLSDGTQPSHYVHGVREITGYSSGMPSIDHVLLLADANLVHFSATS